MKTLGFENRYLHKFTIKWDNITTSRLQYLFASLKGSATTKSKPASLFKGGVTSVTEGLKKNQSPLHPPFAKGAVLCNNPIFLLICQQVQNQHGERLV